MHYSEEIFEKLKLNDWFHRDDNEEFLFKTYKNVLEPGVFNKTDALITAEFCERDRYLTITQGFQLLFDIDCRDRNTQDVVDEVEKRILESFKR